MDEMNLVNAGGWREFGYALGGTLLIAGAPIVAAAPGGRMDRSRWNAWHRNNNAW